MNDHGNDNLNGRSGCDDCPAPEVLAAFLAGSASIDRDVVEMHLLGCDRCVQILGHAAAEAEPLEVPRLVVERAAALVPQPSAVLAFLRGPGALPRTALASAAALAFAFVGYHVGRVNGHATPDQSEFIHVVSFESLSGANFADDFESILLAQTGNRP